MFQISLCKENKKAYFYLDSLNRSTFSKTEETDNALFPSFFCPSKDNLKKKKRKKRQLFSGKRLKDVEQIKMTQKNQKYFANFLLFDSILIHIRYLLINFYNSGKCFSFFFLLLYSENLRKKFAAIYEKKRGNDVTFGKDRKSINIGRIQR